MQNLTMIPPELIVFTVPLTAKFRQQAEKFKQQQSHTKKAQQVYENTLAVLAVNFYCQCLGIETDLDVSESWDPLMQTLSNTGGLSLKNLGILECRPILPHAEWIEIPIDVHQNRLGYLIVEINETEKKATLLGFIKQVTREKVPVNQVESLAIFLDELEALKPITPKLTDWLSGLITTGWQTVETLKTSLQSQPQLVFRNPRFRKKQGIEQGKIIELEQEGHKLGLLVGISPTATSEMNISVEIYPQTLPLQLPPDLELMILDDSGKSVMRAISRGTEILEFQFTGEPGEQFSVKVMIGDISITEPFLI